MTMTDPCSDALSRAFAKRKKRLPLAPDEAEAHAAYMRRYRATRTEVYWVDEEDKKAMQKRAEADGFQDMGAWVRAMVRRGMQQANRTVEEWDALVAAKTTAESRLSAQMDLAHDLMQKANRYERERDDARDRVGQLEARIAEIVGPVAA